MTQVLIVLFCLFISFLLAAAEMAFVAISRPELRLLAKSGRRRAKILLSLRQNPERTLSVLQIGLTLVGAISGAVGGAGAHESLAPYFVNHWHFGHIFSEVLSIFFVVIPITAFTVVVGELIPKSLSLRAPLRVALLSAPALKVFDSLLSPLAVALERITKWSLKVFFPSFRHDPIDHNAPDPIDLQGLPEDHKRYLLNLSQIGHKRIRDIFVPWAKVHRLWLEQDAADIAFIAISCGHTRLPVCDQSGQVIGVLNTKDFFTLISAGDFAWQTIIRPIIAVGENDALLPSLTLMQKTRGHLAVVRSIAGQTLGVVSMEDILEEIVGEIYDESEGGALGRLLETRVKIKKHES